MKKFYFIPINYNGFNFTKDYIESVQNLNKGENDEIRIIIVDNNSNENEVKLLDDYCQKFSNIVVVKNKINLGYFGGLNEGIKQVKINDETMLIIGNNDLTFDKDFILKLKEVSFDMDTMVIAPNIITKDGRHQNPHIIDKVPLSNKIKTDIYNSNYYIGQILYFIVHNLKKLKKSKKSENKLHTKNMFIRMGIGACYILTPVFTKTFSKLDDPVFMWGEEAILAHQVEQENGKILYVNTLIVHHHESASVSRIQSKQRYKIRQSSYRIHRKYL